MAQQLRYLVFLSIVIIAASTSPEVPKRSDVLIPDPSLEPLYHGDTIPEYRWRAYGDIDNDGIEDLVVSDGLSDSSQNGVTIVVYFGDSSGQYALYDSAYGSPNDLCFEDSRGRIRM